MHKIANVCSSGRHSRASPADHGDPRKCCLLILYGRGFLNYYLNGSWTGPAGDITWDPKADSEVNEAGGYDKQANDSYDSESDTAQIAVIIWLNLLVWRSSPCDVDEPEVQLLVLLLEVVER